MTNSIIAKGETAIVTLWDKFEQLVATDAGEAKVFLTAEEKEVLAIAKPILASAEVTALADLKTEAITFLQGLAGAATMSLPDLETALLDAWGATRPELVALAHNLGSTLFQAIIGLLIKQL